MGSEPAPLLLALSSPDNFSAAECTLPNAGARASASIRCSSLHLSNARLTDRTATIRAPVEMSPLIFREVLIGDLQQRPLTNSLRNIDVRRFELQHALRQPLILESQFVHFALHRVARHRIRGHSRTADRRASRIGVHWRRSGFGWNYLGARARM